MAMLTLVRRRLGAAAPWKVLLGAWLVLVIYAFPGQMTLDSFDHIQEARGPIITDLHPPTIVLLWRLVEHVIVGPFGMLVIQTVTFLIGLFLILRRTFAPQKAAWITAALLLFPPIMFPMTVIWKDCLMAGALMLGTAFLFDDRRGRRLAGLALITLAAAFRYNAFAATLPIVVILFEWRPGLGWLRRYAIATGAWLASTLIAFGMNAAIADRQMHFWSSSLAVLDIAGTLNFVDGDLPDDDLRSRFAGTGLQLDHGIHAAFRAKYALDDYEPLVAGDSPMWRVPIYGTEPAPKEQRDAIGRAFWDVVTSFPTAYLEHRFVMMGRVLGLTQRVAGAVIKPSDDSIHRASDKGLATGQSRLQTKWRRFGLWLVASTPLFVPWVYLVLALVLLPLCRKHRDLLALLASGLVLESSLIPLAPSPDYRYSHWMIVCTCIAIVTLIARRARPSPEIAR